MRHVTITVPMCARESLLLEVPLCGDGHRGIWFYDPTVCGLLTVGDHVDFVSGGTVVERAEVVGVEDVPRVGAFEKYCSRVNDKVVQWRPIST